MLDSQYVLLKTHSYIIRMNRDDNLCWYHGRLSRDDAEQILRDAGANDDNKDGIFLVRDSSTSPGDYVLSVLHQGTVCHYQIRRHGDDAIFSIEDDRLIHGLDALIEHYQKPTNGLATQLSAIVKCEMPPVDSRSHGRENLLHRATKEKSVRIVSELLQANTTINIDAKNQDGQTAVHLASQLDENAEEILQRLIEKGANMNRRDKDGNTPLHYAVRRQSAAVIRMLVDAKANMIGRNIKTGHVPLHDAAEYGNMDAVKQLLELEAPLAPRTKYGRVPAKVAEENDHKAVADFLESYIPPEPKTSQSQWYHGTLDRKEAQNILNQHAQIMMDKRKSDQTIQTDNNYSFDENDDEICGLFLVRFSERENTFVLTLLDKDQERNFIIRRHSKLFYIDEGPYMRSLEHLIEHYMRFSDGLPTNLKYPVKPKSKPPVDFSTMPKAKSEHRFPATLHDSGKRKGSVESSPMRTQRSPSFPSDDHMNQISASSELGASPTNNNNNHMKMNTTNNNENSSDKTSTKKSPGKSLLDTMRSLRRKKDSSANKTSDVNENTLGLANDIISQSQLSFTFTDANDSHYNYPTNNASLLADDIKNQNNLGATQRDNIDDAAAMDNDLFTQSDKTISADTNNADIADDDDHDKDNAIEEIYFIDAPTKMVSMTSINYISMKQSPYFPHADQLTSTTFDEPAEQKAIVTNSFTACSERVQSFNDNDILSELQMASSPPNALNNIMPQAAPRNYYIPKSCVQLESILGSGEFGSVHRGFMRCETQQANGKAEELPVAIKTLHDEHCKENRVEFLREASVMLKLSHRCIVNLIGISKGPPLMIIQELVPLGSLLSYLIDNADKIKSNVELKIWASQIASGMHYLETQHFVHRDLAARNILLASIHQAKISDFGLSRALCANNNYYQASNGGKWPIKWYAPESYNFGIFSHASDVWSFGVTLWEMYSYGKPPYGDMKGVDVIQIIDKGERLPKPDTCPDNIFKTINDCWNYKPKQRPKFRYLVNFFSNDPEYQNLIEIFKGQYEQ